MIYAVANQITAVVPFSVTGRESTTVQVEYNGQLSNRVVVPVAPTAPGVFTLDSSGQGAILNQDWRVNGVSAPAASGSVVTIFATGAGQTIPAGDDGFVIGTELPRPAAPVRVSIGGVEAEVLYAGAAPGLVSGVLQLNVRVPSDLPSGQVALLVSIGEATSQANVKIAVGAGGQSSSPDGTGAEIEEKLVDLKSNPAPAPLPELPHDQAPIPADWLALVSWNIQTGGTSPTSTNNRPRMVATALGTLFSGTYQLLAAQEIPNSEAADYLRTLLPGGSSTWQASFFDTSDSMDNGFWYRRSITLRDSFPLYAHSDGSGRLMNDSSKAVHPPQVAQPGRSGTTAEAGRGNRRGRRRPLRDGPS
jgi:uncharacterized protein (TIGR03437 family)